MSRRRAALTTVVFGLLLAPGTASAAPAWVTPFNFPVPASDTSVGGLQGQDQILYQSGGVATEAFIQIVSYPTPLQTVLHIGTMAPGGSYSDQLTIASSEEAIPVGVQIAVAPNGAAVASWTELAGSSIEKSPLRFRAAYRPAGSATWEAPFTIATETERESGFSPTLTPAISASGTAAVGIQRFANGESTGTHKRPNYRVDVAVHPVGGSWHAPERLSPERISATSLALGFDGSGDLTAAYTKRFLEGAEEKEDHSTVIVRRRPASSGVWGPEEDITGSETLWSADGMHLGENEAGDAVVAYQYDLKAPSTLETKAVTRQGPNGSWAAPARLSETSGPAGVGVSPNGMAYVLYSFQSNSSSGHCEGVVRAPVGGSFSPERCLSPPNEDTFSGSVAFLGNDAYFAWRSNVPGVSSNASVQGGRWADGSALPDVAVNLDTPGLEYGFPTLVNDYQGSVVAFYTNPGGMLRAAAYDGGPPILLGTNVPARATAGQPVSFSASFFDLWAGLGAGQPTWSFGDGSAAASGATVTHTFGAPGTYTIGLGAADALGNAAGTTSYTIIVTPAPPTLAGPTVTLRTPSCPKKLSKKACKRYLASTNAWRTLSGTVKAPAGIASVRVAVYLTRGKHVEGLVGKRFRKTTSAKARKTFTAAHVSGARWSLHLPKLKPGRYTILLRATDRAGHLSTVTKTLLLKY
jgi:hypothetical protein